MKYKESEIMWCELSNTHAEYSNTLTELVNEYADMIEYEGDRINSLELLDCDKYK